MSKKSSKRSGQDFLQFRVSRDEQKGAELAAKIEKIADATGLSIQAVANLCLAAGIPMVDTKMREIHEPAKAA